MTWLFVLWLLSTDRGLQRLTYEAPTQAACEELRKAKAAEPNALVLSVGPCQRHP